MSNTNSKSTKPQASDSDQMAVEKETLGDAPLEQHGQICDKTESSPDKHDKGNNTNLKHEGVEKNTKTQVDAPSNKANKDSWAERYGRALMSDRSGDHVGLPYFDGYPWEKAGPVSILSCEMRMVLADTRRRNQRQKSSRAKSTTRKMTKRVSSNKMIEEATKRRAQILSTKMFLHGERSTYHGSARSKES